jgi:iron complex outermembrane recepter protein
MTVNSKLIFMTAAALVASQSGPAMAQDDAAGLEEVIVTAQKRAQNLQDVPIVVTALTESALETAQVVRTRDLMSLVPGLFQGVGAAPRQPYLRGIGISFSTPGQDSPTASYVDGVYIASPMAATMLLNSIQSVEVLKGPQGTLFGRNAVAGVINYRTRDPSFDPGAQLDVGYASYDTISGALYATTPLSESVAFNLSAAHEDQQEGWGRNYFRNDDFQTIRNSAVRSKLLWNAAESVSFILAGWYERARSDQSFSVIEPGVPAFNGFVNTHGRHDTDINLPSFTQHQTHGFSLQTNISLSWAELQNTLSFQYLKSRYEYDLDLQPVSLLAQFSSWTEKTWANELQLISSSNSESKLEWTAGLFLLHDEIPFSQIAAGPLSGNGAFVQTELETQSVAPYVQATYPVTDTTRITGGLRYTADEREYAGRAGNNANPSVLTTDTSTQYEEVTYRVALDHDLTPDLMAYVSYNKGFKSGTYNMAVVSNPPRPLAPEILNAFETGIKSTLFDRRLAVNIGAFYYDYENIIVRAPIAGGASSFDLQNAAEAELLGLDVDFSFQPTASTNIFGGFEILNAEYKDFPTTTSIAYLPGGGFAQQVIDATGNRLPNAPRFVGNLGFSFRQELGAQWGGLAYSGNVAYRGTNYFEADNVRLQDPYALVSAAVQWVSPGEAWDVTVWARNLLDKEYASNRTGYALADIVYYDEPRTVGITVSTRFGSVR